MQRHGQTVRDGVTRGTTRVRGTRVRGTEGEGRRDVGTGVWRDATSATRREQPESPSLFIPVFPLPLSSPVSECLPPSSDPGMERCKEGDRDGTMEGVPTPPKLARPPGGVCPTTRSGGRRSDRPRRRIAPNRAADSVKMSAAATDSRSRDRIAIRNERRSDCSRRPPRPTDPLRATSRRPGRSEGREWS